MKAFGLWVLFLVFGTALICLCLPSFPGYGEGSMRLRKSHKCRKLKENLTAGGYKGDSSSINLLDYHRADPVPSSKASIKHGPILHDAPLLPYIPKPPAPDEPNHNHVDVIFP